jgi:hypothetical protein
VVVLSLVVGAGLCWSAGLQSGQRGGDQAGPGPVCGEPEPGSAGVAGPVGPLRKQAQPQPFGFPAADVVAMQGEGLHPDGEFCCQAYDFEPDPVPAEAMQWKVVQAGVLGAADAGFAASAARRRSSRSGSCPRMVLVANAVSRRPWRSVNRSCAPGCGRSLRTMPASRVATR